MSRMDRWTSVFCMIVVCVTTSAALADFVNGEFESLLERWQTAWTEKPDTSVNYVVAEDDGANQWAHLHGETSWSFTGSEWRCLGGSVELRQNEVWIPSDATELRFDYKASVADNTGDFTFKPYVQIGGHRDVTLLDPTDDWTAVTVPIPADCRGRKTTVYFETDDGIHGNISAVPSRPAPFAIIDLFIDNVSLDGTQSLVTARWGSGKSGAWENPANWRDGVVPGNSASTAYDVDLWGFFDDDTVTVSSDIQVQDLMMFAVEEFRIGAGATLTLRDWFFTGDSNVVMEAGASLIVGSDSCAYRSRFSGGSLTTLAGTGERSLIHVASYDTVIFQLDSGEASEIGGPTFDLTDALIRVTGHDSSGYLWIYDNTQLTFTRTPACTQRVGVEVDSLLVDRHSTVTFNEGTGAYVTKLSVKIGTLNLNNAELGGPAAEDQIAELANYGTVNITGDLDVWASHSVYSITTRDVAIYSGEGELNLIDADVWMNRGLQNLSGSITLVNSTLESDGGEIHNVGALFADDQSAVICGDFRNRELDPAEFDMSSATLELAKGGGGVCKLWCQGADLGAGPAGLVDNFAIGELRIMTDAELTKNMSAVSALYVGQLHVAEGAVLDLNGIPLYFDGDITGGGTVYGTLNSRFLPGDANMDLCVDLDDFIILKTHFGQSQEWSKGDFDANGQVDLDDFNILKANFGRTGAPD